MIVENAVANKKPLFTLQGISGRSPSSVSPFLTRKKSRIIVHDCDTEPRGTPHHSRCKVAMIYKIKTGSREAEGKERLSRRISSALSHVMGPMLPERTSCIPQEA